jgi:hypothetical protein
LPGQTIEINKRSLFKLKKYNFFIHYS